MSDRIVTLRHRQICDNCHGVIPAGERCRMIRDDFMPAYFWFEHTGGCPEQQPDDKKPEAPAKDKESQSTPKA